MIVDFYQSDSLVASSRHKMCSAHYFVYDSNHFARSRACTEYNIDNENSACSRYLKGRSLFGLTGLNEGCFQADQTISMVKNALKQRLIATGRRSDVQRSISVIRRYN